MKLILAWPDWTKYQDRCVMFSWTAEWLDEVYLITSIPLPCSLSKHIHPKCRVIYVGPSLRRYAFVWAARRIAKTLAQDAGKQNEKVIFQELFITRLVPQALIGRWLPRHLFRSVLSFYTPTPTNIRTRAWRTNPYIKLPLSQEWLHIRDNLKRVVMDMICTRFVDAVTGNSKEICQDVVCTYRKASESVYFMPTGIDTIFFTPSTQTLPNKSIILFVGRLYARKGIYDLFKAAKILQSQGLQFELRVIGDNYVETAQVHKAIAFNQLEKTVHMFPHQPRDRIRDELQTASMLILPSYIEGSPRVVKEAMACGCPVIATNLVGIRSLDPAKKALTLVPVGNPRALADAIEGLLRDEKRRRLLGQRGRQQIERKFSPPIVARQWVELYLSLFH